MPAGGQTCCGCQAKIKSSRGGEAFKLVWTITHSAGHTRESPLDKTIHQYNFSFCLYHSDFSPIFCLLLPLSLTISLHAHLSPSLSLSFTSVSRSLSSQSPSFLLSISLHLSFPVSHPPISLSPCSPPPQSPSLSLCPSLSFSHSHIYICPSNHPHRDYSSVE